MSLPKDFFGKKVSRKKKSRVLGEDDSLVSIQNAECEQDDNHVYSSCGTGSGSNWRGHQLMHGTFSANEVSQEFSASQQSFSHFAFIKCDFSTKELLNDDADHSNN